MKAATRRIWNLSLQVWERVMNEKEVWISALQVSLQCPPLNLLPVPSKNKSVWSHDTYIFLGIYSHSCFGECAHTSSCAITKRNGSICSFYPVFCHFLICVPLRASLPSSHPTISTVSLSLPHYFWRTFPIHVINSPLASRVTLPLCECPSRLSSVWSVALAPNLARKALNSSLGNAASGDIDS